MVTQEQQSIIDRAQLQKINGWQHIKVKGTPYEFAASKKVIFLPTSTKTPCACTSS